MNKRLPSEETALKLLKQAGCSKNIVEHCQATADLATEIAEACKKKGFEVDIDLVRIGGLFHDIGRAKSHRVDHGVVGAQIARKMSLPDAVVSIVERHVGGGITESEARRLGFPVKSYIPESLEERIVAYADKLIEDLARVSFEVAVKRFRQDRHISEDAVERLGQWHEIFSLCLK